MVPGPDSEVSTPEVTTPITAEEEVADRKMAEANAFETIVNKKALHSIDPERVLECFLDLVRIDSPSFHELEIAKYCKKVFEDLGCTVKFDKSQKKTGSNVGNLLAILPGTTEGEIVLCAHMDTVNPGVGVVPIIKDGLVLSKGNTVLGADDKAGVASIIEAVKCLVEQGGKYPRVWVLLTTCEERGLLGADFEEFNIPKGTPCLVLDSEHAPGAIIAHAPSKYDFEAEFTGKAAHAGVEPEEGVSAIAIAAEAIAHMNLGRLDDGTTANVGTVTGGRANNIVPNSCVITGECRSMSEAKAKEVVENMDSAMRNAAKDLGGQVKIEWHHRYPAVEFSDDDPLVQLLVKVADKVGLNSIISKTGGGSDANVLSHHGLNSIALGNGMTNYHSLHESIKIEDLENCALYTLAIVYEVAKHLDILHKK